MSSTFSHLLGITVQGSTVSVTSSSSSGTGSTLAAIDTGTTLIGGPTDLVAAIYTKIPGSQQGTGDLAGYYTYRAFRSSTLAHVPTGTLACGTTVNMSITFGGTKSWPISPADFQLQTQSRNGATVCIGAIFDLNGGSSAPSGPPSKRQSTASTNPDWIVGDSFLVSHRHISCELALVTPCCRKMSILSFDMTRHPWDLHNSIPHYPVLVHRRALPLTQEGKSKSYPQARVSCPSPTFSLSRILSISHILSPSYTLPSYMFIHDIGSVFFEGVISRVLTHSPPVPVRMATSLRPSIFEVSAWHGCLDYRGLS